MRINREKPTRRHTHRAHRHRIGMLLALVVGMTGGTAVAGHDDEGGCKKVKGKFEAFNLPPNECTSPLGFCTEGQLKGSLKGSYSFVMLEAIPAGVPDAPAVTFFRGESVVATHKGGVYLGADTGAINLDPPGTLNSGTFSTLLTFTDGAGGHLWIRGTADLAGGTVEGSYRGLVCPE
jgi:hypothetical protein